MKLENLVSGKRTIAIGLVAGLAIGCLVGYWTYTQVLTSLIGRRQIILIKYADFLQIIKVETGYDAEGNIDSVEVVVKNTDDINNHSGIITVGSMEDTHTSRNINLLSGEEKAVSLEITPPITLGEETMILVGIEEMPG